MAAYNWDAYDESVYNGKRAHEMSLKNQAAWSPYGVLCYRTGVCYSYAQAFHLICDIMDMPCVSVTGPGHIWNKVQIGGEWYIVDATNNDGGDDFLSDSLCLIPDYTAADVLNEDDRGNWYIEPYADYSADDGSKDAWDNGDIISGMKRLTLHGCENVNGLSPLAGMKDIEYLALRGVTVSDSDVDIILGFDKLSSLHLSSGYISKDGIDRLKDKFGDNLSVTSYK